MIESVIASVTSAVFKAALSQSKLDKRIRDRLGRKPSQIAFQRALRKSLERLETEHPEWIHSLFDESFLMTEAAPILAQFLVPAGRPNAAELAEKWGQSLNLRRTPDTSSRFRELEAISADFLENLANNLKNDPELIELTDSRSLEQIAQSLRIGTRSLPSTAKTKSDYLHWLIGRNTYLDARGVLQTHRQVQVKLQEVYVSLRAVRDSIPVSVDRRQLEQELAAIEATMARQGSSAEEIEDQRDQIWSRYGEQGKLGEPETSNVVELHEAVSQNRRSVILGDPGSGKSTLLRYLALQHAIATWSGEEIATSMLGSAKFPILVRIADYAEDETWKKKPLSEFLDTACARHECPSRGLADLFDTELSAGRCLVLLDGLDEIVSADDRRGVVRQIEDFVRSYAGHGNKFVVTSRLAGYRNASLGSAFAHYYIQDMNERQIRAFLERWCPAVEMMQTPDIPQAERLSVARREIDGIMNAVSSSLGVRRLATNPLLLRTLALIHRTGAQLPQKRIELYKLAADTLARTWPTGEKGIPESALIKEEYLTRLLRRMAYWLHENKPTGVATRSEVQQVLGAEWAQIAGSQWSEDDPSAGILDQVNELLRVVREHTGLFVERAPNRFGFMHLTFEEYYAARHLVARARTRAAMIREHLHDPRWEEPILLALGFVGLDYPEESSDLFECSILGRGPEAKELEIAPSTHEDILGRDFLFALKCLGDQIPVSPSLAATLVQRALYELIANNSAAQFSQYRSALEARIASLKASEAGAYAVKLILAFCKEGDGLVTLRALDLLGVLGSNSAQIVAVLDECLQNTDFAIQNAAIRCVGTLGVSQLEITEFLIRRLPETSLAQQLEIVKCVGALEDRSGRMQRTLLGLIDTSYDLVRVEALRALCSTANDRSTMLSILKKLSSDKSEMVRALALRQLADWTVEWNDLCPIFDTALTDERPSLRVLLAQLITPWIASQIDARAIVLNLVQSPEVEVRIAALEALSKSEYMDEEIHSALVRCLSSSEVEVRRGAMTALVNRRLPSLDLVQILLQSLDDSDAHVRYLSARGLASAVQNSPQLSSAVLMTLRDPQSATHVLVASINAISGLAALLRDPSREMTSNTRSSIDSAIATLIDLSRHKDPNVKAGANLGLARFGLTQDTVRSGILDGLRYANEWRLRRDCATALAEVSFPIPLLEQTLIGQLELEIEDKVREAILKALASYGRNHPAAETEMASRLRRLIQDRTKPIRVRDDAFSALWLLSANHSAAIYSSEASRR